MPFLHRLRASALVYVRCRWNDILWQSAAVQIFLPPHRVELNRDFAYEHATYGKVNVTPPSRWTKAHGDSSSRIGSKRTGKSTVASQRCIFFGGIALGEHGNQSAAMARLRHFVTMPMCRDNSAVRRSIRPCLVSDSTGPRAMLVGTVSNQGAHCSHGEPRPFYCKAHAASKDHSKPPTHPHKARGVSLRQTMPSNRLRGDELRLDAECACAPSIRTRTSTFYSCWVARMRQYGLHVHNISHS